MIYEPSAKNKSLQCPLLQRQQTASKILQPSLNQLGEIRNTDGNEIDISQSSNASSNNRRMRGKPPGKKMRHAAEISVLSGHQHAEISDVEMQA